MDKELETPTIDKVISATKILNEYEIGQEAPARTQTFDSESNIISQEVPAQFKDITETLAVITQQASIQIETNFIYSPISKINWASHMVLMDGNIHLFKGLKSYSLYFLY